MTGPPLVLLHDSFRSPEPAADLQRALRGRCELLVPELRAAGLHGSNPFTLAGAADSVVEAITQAGLAPAVVCGIGLGAQVGMMIAADQPSQVRGLVLMTAAVRLAPMLMSLQSAVLRLLPAERLARWGASQDQVIGLLAQVRPVDFRGVADRVGQPAQVVCGERDRINRNPSRTLAAALPAGTLKLVPNSAAGWLSTSPALLADLLVAFCRDLP